MCQEYGNLPSSGGILDQDSYVMYGLQAISQAYAELQRKKSSQGQVPQFTGGPGISRR